MTDVAKPATSAITSANLPKPPVQSQGPASAATPTPALVVDAEQPIVAKPLVDSDFTRMKPVNKSLTIFWGNRVANGGLRIEDLKARGFRVAAPSEVLMADGKPCSSGLIRDGHVQRGDLICLLMPTVDYKGQLMLNEQNADRRVSRAANAAKGREILGSALREVGGLPARYRGKIGVYVPDAGDLGKLD